MEKSNIEKLKAQISILENKLSKGETNNVFALKNKINSCKHHLEREIRYQNFLNYLAK